MVTLQPAPLEALSPTELAADMAGAIAALADIEARYEGDREGIVRWVGPDVAKERLLARLEASRVRDRKDLVQWLAEAHRHAATAPLGKTAANETIVPAQRMPGVPHPHVRNMTSPQHPLGS